MNEAKTISQPDQTTTVQNNPFYKNISFQQVVTVGTVAIALFNLYIGSRLAPVAQDISTITSTVKAQAQRLDTLESTTTLYLPRYIATEQQVLNLQKSLDRVEATQIRMEAKIDNLNER